MSRAPFTAIVMLGPEGHGPIEQAVASVRRAAAGDLIDDLASVPEVGRVLFATSETEWAAASGLPVEWDFDDGSPFHFGRRLAGLVERHAIDRLVYFGAGSAPLLGADELRRAVAQVDGLAEPAALTNNLHSSDWVVMNRAERLTSLAERLPNDNALGWILRTEAGHRVDALAPSANTRLDIDTPADFPPLLFHPALKSRLRAAIREAAPDTSRYQAAARRCFTPGSEVALIGRVSSAAWGYLERNTEVWIRVFSEERGMSASGRLAAGRARSLVAEHLLRVGADAFFTELAELTHAAFIDNRVILAHRRPWPSPADRYASDAGRPDLIADEFLRRLTEAALRADLPVVMGGHGVVAGGLYAMVESLQAGAIPAP